MRGPFLLAPGLLAPGLFCAGFALAGPALAEPALTEPALTEPDGAEFDGAALAADHCAACHGADLQGAPDWQRPGPDGRLPAPPHDATGHTWHHGDGFLIDYTLRGGQAVLDDLGVRYDSAMPAFKGTLTEAEVAAILDYIKSVWPEDIRAFQAARTAAEAD